MMGVIGALSAIRVAKKAKLTQVKEGFAFVTTYIFSFFKICVKILLKKFERTQNYDYKKTYI